MNIDSDNYLPNTVVDHSFYVVRNSILICKYLLVNVNMAAIMLESHIKNNTNETEQQIITQLKKIRSVIIKIVDIVNDELVVNSHAFTKDFRVLAGLTYMDLLFRVGILSIRNGLCVNVNYTGDDNLDSTIRTQTIGMIRNLINRMVQQLTTPSSTFKWVKFQKKYNKKPKSSDEDIREINKIAVYDLIVDASGQEAAKTVKYMNVKSHITGNKLFLQIAAKLVVIKDDGESCFCYMEETKKRLAYLLKWSNDKIRDEVEWEGIKKHLSNENLLIQIWLFTVAPYDSLTKLHHDFAGNGECVSISHLEKLVVNQYIDELATSAECRFFFGNVVQNFEQNKKKMLMKMMKQNDRAKKKHDREMRRRVKKLKTKNELAKTKALHDKVFTDLDFIHNLPGIMIKCKPQEPRMEKQNIEEKNNVGTGFNRKLLKKEDREAMAIVTNSFKHIIETLMRLNNVYDDQNAMTLASEAEILFNKFKDRYTGAITKNKGIKRKRNDTENEIDVVGMAPGKNKLNNEEEMSFNSNDEGEKLFKDIGPMMAATLSHELESKICNDVRIINNEEKMGMEEFSNTRDNVEKTNLPSTNRTIMRDIVESDDESDTNDEVEISKLSISPSNKKLKMSMVMEQKQSISHHQIFNLNELQRHLLMIFLIIFQKQK